MYVFANAIIVFCPHLFMYTCSFALFVKPQKMSSHPALVPSSFLRLATDVVFVSPFLALSLFFLGRAVPPPLPLVGLGN